MRKAESTSVVAAWNGIGSGIVESKRLLSLLPSSSHLGDFSVSSNRNKTELYNRAIVAKGDCKESLLSNVGEERTPDIPTKEAKAHSLGEQLQDWHKSGRRYQEVGYEFRVEIDEKGGTFCVYFFSPYVEKVLELGRTSHPHRWHIQSPEVDEYVVHFMTTYIIPWTKIAPNSVYFEDTSSVREYELLLRSDYVMDPLEMSNACISGDVKTISWMREYAVIRDEKQIRPFPYCSTHVLDFCGASELSHMKEMAAFVYSDRGDGLKRSGPFPWAFFDSAWHACCYDNIEWYISEGFKVYGEPDKKSIDDILSRCINILEGKEKISSPHTTVDVSDTIRDSIRLKTKVPEWAEKYIPVIRRIRLLCELAQFRQFRRRSPHILSRL